MNQQPPREPPRPAVLSLARRVTALNRDRGASHDAAPPTPPGIRVRTTAVRRIKRPPASPWKTIQDL
jgi:hypothetical protein